MTTQAFQYINDNRKDLLNFIKRKGLSHHDAEDLLSEASVDVCKYYNVDMAKSVHLAIERQIALYYKGYSKVSTTDPQEVRYVESSYEEMMESRNECEDPLVSLIREEAISRYPELIDRFATSQPISELLYLIYVDDVPTRSAADIVGFNFSTARTISQRFLTHVGG